MAPLILFQTFLLLLTAVCWAQMAEIISLRSTPSAQSRALMKRIDSQENFAARPTPDVGQELELLDILLVASVDGKFHALNRTSGDVLWSMSSFSLPSTTSTPSSLAPLVRTQHVDYDPDEVDETTPQETYIIEPQSGDIYIMTKRGMPLRRFPLSVPELVDSSPFTAPGEYGKRMFIGRKETSLILLELETGKIKATFNSECPPYEDNAIDLDELEDDETKTSKTEVYIGRTDYYITIYSSQVSSDGVRPPAQNLSFSVYGPNNKDHLLQTSYRKTPDGNYAQGLKSGLFMGFKIPQDGQTKSVGVYAKNFGAPIVAIFDVLRGQTPLQTHPHAFVLLQPRPRLEDLFGKLPNTDSSAYVGMVEETGSLYTLSPIHFPLTPLDAATPENAQHRIDGPDSSTYSDDDAIAEEWRKEQEERDKCEENPYDRRCLLGMHPLDKSDGHESRMKRLLEGPKPPGLLPLRPGQVQLIDHSSDVDVIGGGLLGEVDPPPTPNGSRNAVPAEEVRSKRWETIGVAILLGFISLWLLFNNKFKSKKASKPAPLPILQEEQPVVAGGPVAEDPVPATPVARNIALPTEPKTPVKVEEQLKDHPKEPGAGVGEEEGDETDREGEADGEATPVPGKRKARRGKRGKKKKGGKEAPGSGSGQAEDEAEGKPINEIGAANGNADLGSPALPQTSLVIQQSVAAAASPGPSLFVSETILGFGSHGTVVFKGSLQGRAVAVKRLLKDFVTLASREVSILQESDDHPNVIRYYYQEAHANFLYIALELCPASLADIIECPDRDQFRDIAISFDPKKALKQITSGLRHLHGLKLVHRDIKPQNILISTTKSNHSGRPTYRMLISDFGLCKKLDVDQTSFLPTTAGGMAAGTVGWRAPEILRGEVNLDEVSDDHSMSSRGSVATVNGSSSSNSSSSTAKPTRLTKSVDIFALGCLYYYTLTNGGHPFGDRFEREMNILKNAKSFEALDRFGEEGTEGCDLIEQMLNPEASQRPDTTSCLLHPFFWDAGRRLNFLTEVSDRFERLDREPKDPYLLELEKGAQDIVGNDWLSRLDKTFIENLGKYRKYDAKSVQDLLRALRNKKNHYQDLPENVKRNLGPMPDGFLAYFTKRYPKLFLHVHSVIRDTGLRTESNFKPYFELPDVL